MAADSSTLTGIRESVEMWVPFDRAHERGSDMGRTVVSPAMISFVRAIVITGGSSRCSANPPYRGTTLPILSISFCCPFRFQRSIAPVRSAPDVLFRVFIILPGAFGIPSTEAM